MSLSSVPFAVLVQSHIGDPHSFRSRFDRVQNRRNTQGPLCLCDLPFRHFSLAERFRESLTQNRLRKSTFAPDVDDRSECVCDRNTGDVLTLVRPHLRKVEPENRWDRGPFAKSRRNREI